MEKTVTPTHFALAMRATFEPSPIAPEIVEFSLKNPNFQRDTVTISFLAITRNSENTTIMGNPALLIDCYAVGAYVYQDYVKHYNYHQHPMCYNWKVDAETEEKLSPMLSQELMCAVISYWIKRRKMQR